MQIAGVGNLLTPSSFRTVLGKSATKLSSPQLRIYKNYCGLSDLPTIVVEIVDLRLRISINESPQVNNFGPQSCL